MFVSGLFTCDMGFTLALSSILVATGNSCWGADDANVTAVTADAAIRIWGFKTIPARQTIGTLTTRYCKLTLTLASYLEVKNTEEERDGQWREKKQVLNLKTYKLSKLKFQGFHGHQQFSVCFGVYLGTLHAAVDCSSSVTVAWLTHIKGSGIRFLQSEKPTDTQLTVLPWQWKRQKQGETDQESQSNK